MSDLVGNTNCLFAHAKAKFVISETERARQAERRAERKERKTGGYEIIRRNKGIYHMSHDARKLVFGVYNKVRDKPACTAAEEV